jgi:hypothetical protein
MAESVVVAWHGDGATTRTLLDGAEQRGFRRPGAGDSELADELRAFGIRFSAIGDCLAARHVAAAIFAGRRLGLALSGGY